MKSHMKKIAAFATTLALCSFSTADAGGCGSHGGHGGISIGFGGVGISLGQGGGRFGHVGHSSHSVPSHHAHLYPAPSQHYPVPSQHVQTYPAPTYPRSLPASPIYTPPVHSQPSYPREVYSQSNSPSVVYSNNSNVQQGNPVQQNSFPQQGMPQQPNTMQQGGTIQQGQQGVAQGGMQSQGNMGPSQGSMAAPTQQQVAPQTGVANAQPQQPMTGAPQGGPTVGQPNAGAPAASGAPQAELSALQMLASLNGDATGAAMAEVAPQAAVEALAVGAESMSPNPSIPSNAIHVGTWRVALPGNQNISLALNPDHSFQWNAVKDGKSSSFQGQYRMEAGRLTLVRSNDLQQMAGNWSGEGANFTFKLDGATTSGLAFSRAE